MRTIACFLFGALFFCILAAAALLPSLAALREEPVSAGYAEQFSAESLVRVIVRGDASADGVQMLVPYGSTYGEVFALAGVAGDTAGYDLFAPLSFEDAYVIGGELCFYIVV